MDSLIRIDFLDAQRPLSDEEGSRSSEDLSHRLSKYYKHLQQHDTDFTALQALAESEQLLNRHFQTVFQPTIEALRILGYPGLDNPILAIKSVLNPESLLARHGGGTQVHYSLPGAAEMTLPDATMGSASRTSST